MAASLAANLYIHARLIAQGKPVSGPNYGIHRSLAEAKATNVALSDAEEAALTETLAEIDREMKKPAQTIDRSSNNQIANTKTALLIG